MQQQIYTIGHSNHSAEELIRLLQMHDLEVIVDVRSSPYSKFNRQFNKSALSASLKTAGLKYLFLGRELGGKPEDPAFYDENGFVLYWKIAERQDFKDAIARVLNGISLYRVALMCSEENPTGCHRRLLLGRVLRSSGVELKHIRGNGCIELEEDLLARSQEKVVQMQLFAVEADQRGQWKSSQPILPGKNLPEQG